MKDYMGISRITRTPIIICTIAIIALIQWGIYYKELNTIPGGFFSKSECNSTAVNGTLGVTQDIDSLTQPDIDTITQPDTERLGIVTFLCTRSEENATIDNYYNATRVLIYKLLHDPATKTQKNIPIIVMVTETVEDWKRDQLSKDGAIVVEVDYIKAEGAKPTETRWIDQYTKLHIWHLTMYDRMLYVDCDMLITAPLDGAFEDANSYPIPTINKTDSRFPDSFLLTGVVDSVADNAKIPRPAKNSFNAGFFMFKPDLKLFRLYHDLMADPSRYLSSQMEQGLLNNAHKLDGHMPWRRFNEVWNVNWPTYNDYQYGCPSLHEKWWKTGDSKLRNLWVADLNKTVERDPGPDRNPL